MFASLSSQTSYFVSKMLKNHLLPAYEGLSSRKTGIMFGAKAVAKIRDVQIHDPVTLTNTKEFLRQCFMKPYIIGNNITTIITIFYSFIGNIIPQEWRKLI
ncbi:putative traG protein [Orientia tsutsugamushi str. UT76]|nr:putative traG protein [Orientia tsutsugamushi str. UT76]